MKDDLTSLPRSIFFPQIFAVAKVTVVLVDLGTRLKKIFAGKSTAPLLLAANIESLCRYGYFI